MRPAYGHSPTWYAQSAPPAPLKRGDRRRWAIVGVGLVVAIVLSATALYLVLDRPSSPSGPPSSLPPGTTIQNATVTVPAMGWEPTNRTTFVGYVSPNGTWNNVFNMTWHASGPVSFAWGKFYPPGTLFYPCYGFTNCSALWMPALSSQPNVSGWGSSSECCASIVGMNATTLEVWNYGNTSVQFTYHAWWNYSAMVGGWPVGSNSGTLSVPPVGRTPQWFYGPYLSRQVTSSSQTNGTWQWHVELSGPDCVGYVGNFTFAFGPYHGTNPNATPYEVYIPGPGAWVTYTGPPNTATTSWYGPNLVLKCDSPTAGQLTVKWWWQSWPS